MPVRLILAVTIIGGLLLFMLTGVAWATAGSWSEVAADTQSILAKATQAYQLGQVDKARKIVDEAYFGPFESQGMEAAIRLSLSAARAFEHEGKFRDIKLAMLNKEAPANVQALVDQLGEMLRQDAARLDGSRAGSSSSFFNSLVIIVREGLEAILVIGALTAYMIKSGNQPRLRTIHYSVGLALAASAVTAVALRFLINTSGASQENLEGITMLLAVAVLVLVSYWLISKAQAKRWQEYIQGKIKTSLGAGSNFALGSAAFLAVYREGAETVLFYQALISSNPASALPMIVLGLAVGLVVLAAIYAIMRFGVVKIPLKPFFTVTGMLLFYLAFVFAGQGVNELQAGGLVGSTALPGMPVIGFLGIYPTWQTLSLQLLLAVTYVAGLGYQFVSDRWRRPASEAA